MTLFYTALASCILVHTVVFAAPTADGPIVQVNQGQIQGSIQSTPNGKQFYGFVGIPYAEPPLGDLRFKAPVKAGSWNGIRDGTIEQETCVQPGLNLSQPAIGVEDCLYLSVFTTALPPDATALPVHIFIHGGAYFIGEDEESKYGPHRFFDNTDMVIIIMNYRLGTLGFLGTEDAVSPGNYGLLDQLMSLEWVRDNIVAFGGNPSDVTLSGESAGAASVMYHIVSPKSVGLFQRAITESGTALMPWALQEHPLHFAQLVAEKLSCPTNDSSAMVDCLRQQDAYDLAEEEFAVMLENLALAFVPCVEPANSGVFLTEDPRVLLQEGRFNKVPLITGFNRDEGILVYQFIYPLFKDINDAFFNDVVPLVLTALTDYRTNLVNVSYAIKDVYYNIDLNDESAVTRASVDMLSDMFLKPWCVETLNYFTAQNLPVYMYYYVYEGDLYWTNFTGGTDITHTIELMYLYNVTNDAQPPLSARDTAFSANQFVPLWANYITQGNPTPSGDTIWTTTPPGHTYYLSIDEQYSFTDGYDLDRMDFWLNTVPGIVNG